MSEAVEYRVKRNRLAQLGIIALMVNLVGMLCLVIGAVVPPESAFIPFGMGLLYLALSTYIMIIVKAIEEDGRCRAFMEWRGREYPDPPLDEWEDSLEERDAFEVDI